MSGACQVGSFHIVSAIAIQYNNVVLYCIVLYCIVLYCIVLYCIVLYCMLLINVSGACQVG